MHAAIIGLSGAGKSSLFQALTGERAEPPGSVRPILAVAEIPDARLELLGRYISARKRTAATMQVLDSPALRVGLSAGGATGRVLARLREADALVHVVACFDRPGSGAGARDADGADEDVQSVDLALLMADLEHVEGLLPRAERAARGGQRSAVAKLEALRRAHEALSEGRALRSVALGADDEEVVRGLGLLSAKPMLLVANVAEEDLSGSSEAARRVAERAAEQGVGYLAICARVEAELAELAEEDRGPMLAALGLTEPALHALARAMFGLLGLQTFYTVGPKEIRAWPIRQGATAPEAAGAVHSDMQRGFIRAEVYSVEDLQQLGSEKAVREAGRLRIEGRSYVMRDGDVARFLFGT